MRNRFSLLFVVFAFMFYGCGVHWDELLNSTGLEEELKGRIPSSVIPDAIRSNIESSMPVHEGTTPPDIKGQYVSNNSTLVGSSISNDNIGSIYVGNTTEIWADLYIAFIEGAKEGTLSYVEREITRQSVSDDVTLEVVGKGEEFSAYFISEGTDIYDGRFRPECDYDIWFKRSTVISGTWTSNGISNLHYSFVTLEKGSDPYNCMVPVNSYRVFKDGDGLADRINWLPQ
jgi:hypothetical protein